MGKRALQTRPSLNSSKKHHPQKLDHYLKVSKPKVYITDSSNFKTLVQDVTGNGSSPSLTLPPLPVPPMPVVVSPEPAHVILIDDDHDTPDYHDTPDPSPDVSFDNSVVPFDYSYCSSEELGMQWPQDCVVDHMNEMELRNLESWLLDFDSSGCVSDGPYVTMNAYNYDYNLSTIM